MANREALPERWKDLVAYATERGHEVVEDPTCPPHMIYVQGEAGESLPVGFNMESGEHGVAFPFNLN